MQIVLSRMRPPAGALRRYISHLAGLKSTGLLVSECGPSWSVLGAPRVVKIHAIVGSERGCVTAGMPYTTATTSGIERPHGRESKASTEERQ
jgi:hypothetical protein